MTTTPDLQPDPTGAGIIYFDGYCGLCDRFVSFLLARDHRRQLRFAPLQGQTAARRLGSTATTRPPQTVIFVDAAGSHQRSTAALRAVAALGGAWRLVRILALVPRPLRDGVYDWVARHRDRWFGRSTQCRLPTPAERHAFLP